MPARVSNLFARVLPPPANIQRVRGGNVPLSALHALCHQIFAHVQGEPDRADPRVRADPRRERSLSPTTATVGTTAGKISLLH